MTTSNGSPTGLHLTIRCHHCDQVFDFLLANQEQTCPHCGQSVTRMEAIESFLRSTMATTFSYDRNIIRGSSRLNEIGDSMGTIELLMRLEKEFGIAIDHDDIEELETVASVCSYINRKVEKSHRHCA